VRKIKFIEKIKQKVPGIQPKKKKLPNLGLIGIYLDKEMKTFLCYRLAE